MRLMDWLFNRRTVFVRDLKPGDRVIVAGEIATVARTEWLDEMIYYKKMARALKVSFLDHRFIRAHPGEPVKLVL